MKVLLLHDIGTATGGAELQMFALRRGLRSRGHDARLLSTMATPVSDHPREADYICFGTNNENLQVLTQTANPFAYMALRRVLHSFQPDVVHVRLFLWQLSPLILPLLRGIPALYQTAMYKSICPKGTNMLPDRRACSFAAGRACLQQGCLTPQSWAVLMMQHQLWRRWRGAFDATVVLSRSMKQQFEADPSGPLPPIEVVPNGVPERPMRPPLSNPPTVAFAGRLVPEKGVDVLLHAMDRLRADFPSLRLLIAGQGSDEPRLRSLARRLGLDAHIRWLGYLPRDEMEQRFEAAWVQAVPSTWDEPFGNVTLEAMMRGTAVVASTVGGQVDIVDSGTSGFLVPPQDAEALAGALRPLLSDREHAEEVGRLGRQRALAHFSEDQCVERFVRIYTRLIRAHASAKNEG